MSLYEAQATVKEFCTINNLESKAEIHLLDLMSELGEVSKEYLKATKYGKDSFIPNAKWSDELGDAVFAMLCLANSTDSNLDSVLSKVLEKYRKRIVKYGNPDSGG